MHTRSHYLSASLVLCAVLTIAQLASAQTPEGVARSSWPNINEYGIDGEVVAGFGHPSTFHLNLPAGRFRFAWFLNQYPRIAIEPAVSIDYSKVEGSEGVLIYDIEVGGIYQISRLIVETKGERGLATKWTPYVRPFLGFTGFSDSDSRAQFTGGAGFGFRKPLKRDFALRMETNAGWIFNPTNFRVGFLIGLSFFPH